MSTHAAAAVVQHAADLQHPDGDDQAANVFPHDRYLTGLQALAAVEPLTPTEKKDARSYLTRFCLTAEQHRDAISYTQARPFDPTVTPERFRGDCSSYVTQAFWWAWDHLDGVPLHDPNGPTEWDGYGFTGTLLATNHAHHIPLDHRFFVGDLALYGTFWATRHVVMCRKGGLEKDAIWSSHGSRAGPNPVRLRYRSDLLGVYRPASLL